MFSKYKDGSVQHSILFEVFANMYNAKKVEVIFSAIENTTWNEGSEKRKKSIVSFLRICSDKTEILLKGYALLEYPMHAVQLNVLIQF